MDLNVLEREIKKSKQMLYDSKLLNAALKGKLTSELYKGFLQETYHYVKNTSRFYAAAACRLKDEYEEVRKNLLLYAAEENGHEKYLLNDLKVLGIDPNTTRKSEPLVATEALNGFHYYLATFGNPLGILGNIYAIEGFSNDAAGIAAKSIMEALGLRKNAVTFLVSHAAFDIKHFRNAEAIIQKFINQPDDERSVIFCARGALELYASMYDSIYEHYQN